jgi:hypothetical protein
MTEVNSHQLYQRDWNETTGRAEGLSLSFSADGIRLHEYHHLHRPGDEGQEHEYDLFLDDGQLRPLAACVANVAKQSVPLPENVDDLRSFLVDGFRSLAASGWFDERKLTDVVAGWLTEAGVPYHQERHVVSGSHTIFGDAWSLGSHSLFVSFADGKIKILETYDHYAYGDDDGQESEYIIEVDTVHLRPTAAYLRDRACLIRDDQPPGPLPDTVEGLRASLVDSLRALAEAGRLGPTLPFRGSYRG